MALCQVLGKPEAIVVVPIIGIVVIAIAGPKVIVIVVVPGPAAQTPAFDAPLLVLADATKVVTLGTGMN